LYYPSVHRVHQQTLFMVKSNEGIPEPGGAGEGGTWPSCCDRRVQMLGILICCTTMTKTVSAHH
jgi:hypothetical protein